MARRSSSSSASRRVRGVSGSTVVVTRHHLGTGRSRRRPRRASGSPSRTAVADWSRGRRGRYAGARRRSGSATRGGRRRGRGRVSASCRTACRSRPELAADGLGAQLLHLDLGVGRSRAGMVRCDRALDVDRQVGHSTSLSLSTCERLIGSEVLRHTAEDRDVPGVGGDEELALGPGPRGIPAGGEHRDDDDGAGDAADEARARRERGPSSASSTSSSCSTRRARSPRATGRRPWRPGRSGWDGSGCAGCGSRRRRRPAARSRAGRRRRRRRRRPR